MIAQIYHDNVYLKYAEKEINELRKQLKNDYSSKARNCYSSLHPGRKCLVEPLEVSDEEYINKWMSKPYVPKGFKEEDNTEYYTENGERVRSKSEVIIANTLKSLNIPYKYECIRNKRHFSSIHPVFVEQTPQSRLCSDQIPALRICSFSPAHFGRTKT